MYRHQPSSSTTKTNELNTGHSSIICQMKVSDQFIKRQSDDSKYSKLKSLRDQLDQQRTGPATFENDFQSLKEIFLRKERELNLVLSRVNGLTKQLEQLRKCRSNSHDDNSQQKNQLEKLQQELFIRNKLNEEQNRKIAYQRQLLASKRTEMNQLDQRIEELQQSFKSAKEKCLPSPKTFQSVEETLNDINIAEIEKRMIQLAQSFNSISPPSPPMKIAFASKTAIAATYMSIPISKGNDDVFPAKLNDDILSIHFNPNKKRHSFCESIDSPMTKKIEVHDESIYENLSSDREETFCEQLTTIIDSFASDTESEGSISDDDLQSITSLSTLTIPSNFPLKSLLKTSETPKNTSRRVIFDPFALLLDAAVIGDVELLIESAKKVNNISRPNDEGLTALHNAVCASHFDCVRFLVEFGSDVNYADNDGWTPLHCAASCNNTLIVQYLVERGASLFAVTHRDLETPAEKCEEYEENYQRCFDYLRSAQDDLGVINDGLVYALFDYENARDRTDELSFENGDRLIILKREDQWWWAKHFSTNREGFVPRNYLGLFPRLRRTVTKNC